MIKATILLNLFIISLLTGCWKPDIKIISSPSIEPYNSGYNYRLTRDFFIIQANSGVSNVTAENLLVGSGVLFGGRKLPSSGEEYDRSPDLHSGQIQGYLKQGTVLTYLHTAFVTDWYSNTEIYYGVFENGGDGIEGVRRYMIRYGPLIPGSRFSRYPSIVAVSDIHDQTD